jgi:hypothetical protein
MTRYRSILPLLLLAFTAFAHAQGNPVNDAMKQGLTTRGTTPPKTHEMTQAEWRRLQLAAADKSEEIMRDAQKRPGLLAQYAYMQQNYDANHERAFQLIFGQYLSWYQTWIADYDAARHTFSIAQPVQADDAPSPLTTEYQSRPAIDAIVELAKDRKAVFLNEAHSAPITRTLTVQLLVKLRAEGFNYFAAETLYASDKDLQKRGYPLIKSGFYVNEPIYGEMVRTALKLGYKVIAYDAEDAGMGDSREKGGAEALYDQVFKRDPNARLVVNAGFAHIQKSGVYLGGSSMAEFFKKISGIDPLAVDQTMLIQHGRPDQDHPYYQSVIAANTARQPFVYMTSAGKAWSLKANAYDVSVFFPPQQNIEGRPDWVNLGGLRMAYPVGSDLCRNQFPCLVEARYPNEIDDSVAADRVVLNIVDEKAPITQRLLDGHGTAQGRLYLRPGSYRLLAIDRNGHTITARDLEIKEGDVIPSAGAAS